jgi:hypothetical protein
LLAERARAYTEAAWRDKWGALLPVRTQAQLIAARVRRRFRYGEYRAFALGSLVRGLPAAAMVALLGVGAADYEAAAQIEKPLAWLQQGRLTEDAAAALSDLATRSWVTRWRLVRDGT